MEGTSNHDLVFHKVASSRMLDGLRDGSAVNAKTLSRRELRRSVKLNLVSDNTKMGFLTDGTVINLSRTPTVFITAELAGTLRRRAASFQFFLDGKLINTVSSSPYVMYSAGKSPWMPTKGPHTLTVIAKSRKGGKGLRVARTTVKFTVIAGGAPAAPTNELAPASLAAPVEFLLPTAPATASVPVAPFSAPVELPSSPMAPSTAMAPTTEKAPVEVPLSPIAPATVSVPLAPSSAMAPTAANAPLVPPSTTAPATPAPATPAPTNDPCSPSESFAYFAGHNFAMSVNKSEVDMAWPPALFFHIRKQEFLDCGNFTYDLHVAKGIVNFNVTGPELMQLRNEDGSDMVHLSTSALQMVVRNLEPGMNYSILVNARSARGHYSLNRNAAEVKVAAWSPVINKDFTRMVVIPTPSNDTSFQIVNNEANSTVVFVGNLTAEMLDLKPKDFIYFFDSEGNSTMGQVLEQYALPLGSTAYGDAAAMWKYIPKETNDIFDELDMGADVTDVPETTEPANATDTGADDSVETEAFLKLPLAVQLDFCLMAFPGSASDVCAEQFLQPADGRRLFLKSLFKKGLQKVVKVFKTVTNVVVTIAKTIVAVVKEEPITKDFSLFSVDKAEKFVAAAGALEIGMRYVTSLNARFTMTLSLTKGLKKASMEFFGGFQIEGYVYMQASTDYVYAPKPTEVFSKSFDKTFFVGVVPVVVSLRPGVYFFAKVVVSAEGKALAVASPQGYKFSYEFSYDESRSDKYRKKSSFNKLANPIQDPKVLLET
jgi:hypothetical protein